MRKDVGEEEPINVSISVNKIITHSCLCLITRERERKNDSEMKKIREMKKE